MRGPVDCTADSIVGLFAGSRCAYSNEQLAEFAGSLIRRTGEAGLRTSLLAGQIAHETARFTYGGQVQPEQFNFAGLGATNGGAAGASFGSIDDGVIAVCQHHLAYVVGSTTGWPNAALAWPMLDERNELITSGAKAGVVRVIGDYTNGRWAFTPAIPLGGDNGYARAIVLIADSVSVEIQPGGNVVEEEYPTEAAIGCLVRIEATDFDNGARDLSTVRWGVVHDTEGHFEGDIATLTHGSRSGSIHAIIGRERGQFVASVPIRRSAYAAGNDLLGDAAIQVELSHAPQSGELDYTDWQYEALAAFYRWAIGQGAQIPLVYFWPHPPDGDGGPLPDDPGFIGHYGVPNPNVPGAWGGISGHTDPGDAFDWPRFMALMQQGVPPGVPAPPAEGPLVFAGLDKYTGERIGMGGAFKRLYISTPFAVQAFGLPVANEHRYHIFNGLTGKNERENVVGQETDRVFLEYNPDPAVAGAWDATVLPWYLRPTFVGL